MSIVRWLKRTKKTPIRNTAMKLLVKKKKRLSPITSLLLNNLRVRAPESVKEVSKEAFQLLELISSRYKKRIKIKLRT